MVLVPANMSRIGFSPCNFFCSFWSWQIYLGTKTKTRHICRD